MKLIDATTGNYIWAEKFDRELIEIFVLQDEITRNVVAATQTQILLKEGDRWLPAQKGELGVWMLINKAMAPHLRIKCFGTG